MHPSGFSCQLALVIGWPALNPGLLVRAPALPVTLS
nr:MAG TPA: hypothetical protein [Caudoviricetes sp.]